MLPSFDVHLSITGPMWRHVVALLNGLKMNKQHESGQMSWFVWANEQKKKFKVNAQNEEKKREKTQN